MNYTHAYNNRGCAWTKLKQFDKAREDILKAKELASQANNSKDLKIIEEDLKKLDEAEKGE